MLLHCLYVCLICFIDIETTFTGWVWQFGENIHMGSQIVLLTGQENVMTSENSSELRNRLGQQLTVVRGLYEP